MENKNTLENLTCCFNCGMATYIGDGGYMCDKHDKIVIDEWEATDNFMCCDGKDYKGDD